MSDNGEVEVENPSGYQVLPKDVTEEIGSIKLFNKWSYEDVEIRDISLTYVALFVPQSLLSKATSPKDPRRAVVRIISLTWTSTTPFAKQCIPRRRQDPANLFNDSDYIQIRSPVYMPHSAGRYANKRFRKAQCPIIERLTNSLMMNGRNNGKKLMAVRIVAHSFEIVCSLVWWLSYCLTAYPTFIDADPHHDRSKSYSSSRRCHRQLRSP